MNDTLIDRFEIVRREDFSDVTYLLEVSHPMMARAAHPGQFVIVMSHAAGERIPLTIADFDRDKGTITLVIQAVGKTTLEMQQTCRSPRAQDSRRRRKHLRTDFPVDKRGRRPRGAGLFP